MGLSSFLSDALSSAWDAITEHLGNLWDSIVEPFLGEIFGLFGIDDETVVLVEKISMPLYEHIPDDIVHKAIVRSVLTHISTEGDRYFDSYMKEIYRARAMMRSYARFARLSQNVYPEPALRLQNKIADEEALNAALDIEKNGSFTLKSYSAGVVNFKYLCLEHLQENYSFSFLTNTLTHTDTSGTLRTDFAYESYNHFYTPQGNGTHIDTIEITVGRQAENAVFWIEGPINVLEGDSITFQVRCNRTVPVGESIDINLAYTTSTATEGVDYNTPPAIATITAGNDLVDVTVSTIENTNDNTGFPRDLTISIDSIDNSAWVFEAVSIDAQNSILFNILDEDAVVLTMPEIWVDESAGIATINVKLEQAASGAFTVDYATSEITAVAGVDYTHTAGQLSFAGTAGEIQSFNVPILSNSPDAVEFEQFLVSLSNCSDAGVDDTFTATVTIKDNTEVTPTLGTVLHTEVISFDRPATTVLLATQNFLNMFYYPDAGNPDDYSIWVYDYSTGKYDTPTGFETPGTDEYDWLQWLVNNLRGSISVVDGSFLPGSDYLGIEASAIVLVADDALPSIPLRVEKTFVNTDTQSDEYKSSKRLAELAGLDVDELIDGIQQTPENLDNIDDIHVTFACSPHSTNMITKKLIYDTFSQFIDVLVSVNPGQFAASLRNFTLTYKQGAINAALAFTNLLRQSTTGGTLYNNVTARLAVGEYETKYFSFLETDDAGNVIDGGDPFGLNDDDYTHAPAFYIYYRFSETELRYIKIDFLNEVTGISYDGYSNLNFIKPDSDYFTFPFMLSAWDALTPEEQLEVWQHVLRIDFYAIDVQHLAWYETSAFYDLFEFILLAVSIAALFFGFVGGGFVQVLYNAAISQLLIGIVEFVVEATGNAALAAVVGVVAGIALGQGGRLPFSQMTTGEQILEISTNFADNLATAQGSLAEGLEADIRELNALAEERLGKDELADEEEGFEQLVDVGFLTSLLSNDSLNYQAITIGYDFDNLYDYDAMVSNFFETKLSTGVV